MANANVRQISPHPVYQEMTPEAFIALQRRVIALEEFIGSLTFSGVGATPPSPSNRFVTEADLP